MTNQSFIRQSCGPIPLSIHNTKYNHMAINDYLANISIFPFIVLEQFWYR